MRQNPGGNITKHRFGPLFTAAWGKSASVSNATSGIHPFDPNAIPEEAFAPSETTEREMEAVINQEQPVHTGDDEDVIEDMDTEDSEDASVDTGAPDAQSSTSPTPAACR